MSEQQHVDVTRQEPEPEPLPDQPAPAAPAVSTGGLDSILDEIDEVLDVNAAEFVAAYVQKGGE